MTDFIKIDSGITRLHKLLVDYQTKGLQSDVDAVLDQSIRVMTESVRYYMPARHRLAKRNPKALQKRLETATGRLWSGWGIRETVIHRDDDGRRNPTEPSDNYYFVRQIGSGANTKYRLVTGTRVRYAEYVDEGRPKWHKGRPVYDFKRLGRQRALRIIGTFADTQLNESLSQLEKQSSKKSMQVRQQTRDKRGRFGPKKPKGSIVHFIA